MHIRRADSGYFAQLLTPNTRPGGFWKLHANGIMPPDANAPTVLEYHADGFISDAAWRVHCPWCAGCQFGDPATQTRFMCVECGNRPADGAWIGVRWPDELDEIESVLLRRLDPATMNWFPHEAVEHLYAENIDHDIITIGDVPEGRRRVVQLLVDAAHEVDPVHAIAPGTIVHPDSEWHAATAAKVIEAMGHNASEDDVRRALMIYGVG